MTRFAPLLCYIIMSCTEPTMPSVVPGESFSIHFGQSVVIPSFLMSVRFSGLVDDRCPEGAICSANTYAKLKVSISISKLGFETFFMYPYILDGATLYDTFEYKSVDTLGYRLTLLQLDPHPTIAGRASNDKYIATMRIIKH